MSNVLLKRRADNELLAPVDLLRRWISYCPQSGKISLAPNTLRKSKKPIGNITKAGYVSLRITGIDGKSRRYMGHRVAWALHYGQWPALHIDHINGDRSDNRITNLRFATNAQNCMNCKGHSNSLTGIKGVTWDKTRGKWMARLNKGGKFINLGRFDTSDEAKMAYDAAAADAHGEYFRAA
ncbi:HNH endonuclease [Acetobacter lambici]|uniref:HNH endonuclease n=1 Tax=Acetobacter lambici TaxID=1332824 RepID=A0ABT1F034_9PROT|nr:HNH endonuclease [Acetobacter lambici]MCP1243036.1 HNH endonuclease [Acetobacter lambici]MCP1258545.1 HNH endonuclease [Acetobacter lambici]